MDKEKSAAHKGTRNIVILGLISCFADISSEMVYPIVPLYLTAALGATPALVGLIEGIAESLASLLKVFSGYVSDRFQKKKALAFSGYATGVIYKLALLLTRTWGGVLAARVIDRFGKDIYVLHDDGEHFRVRADINVSNAFLGWIMQFGTDAEIISPHEVCERIGKLASNVAGMYKK